MSVFNATGPISSDARAVAEEDTVTFLVPMAEIPGGAAAGFRVAAGDGVTMFDVSGITGADSLIGVPAGPVPTGCGAELLGPTCGAQGQANLSRVASHLDPAGDLWLEFVFEQDWPSLPPNDLPGLGLFYTLTTSSGSSGGQWAVFDGTTSGWGTIGDEATDLELYLTPQGTLSAKLPGRGQPGGYSLDSGLSLLLDTITRRWSSLDGTALERSSTFPLTTARTNPFAGPDPSWTRVEVDIGPFLVLTISGG